MPRAVGLDRLYREAQHQRRLWTPRGGRPIGWFDAADIATIQAPDGVSSWANKGSGGGVAQNATVAQRPAFSSAGFNGRPCLRFDSGGSQTLVHTLTQASAWTIFAVWVNTTAQSATRGVCSFGAVSATGGTALFARVPGAAFMGCWNVADIPSTHPYGLSPQIGGVIDRNDGTGSFRVNGGAAGTFSGINPNGQPAHIGGVPTEGNAMLLAEAVALDRVASVVECEYLEGYLAWKWGLQGILIPTHAYRNRPPLVGA